MPKGKSPGWIIPEEMKHRWTLTLGRSSAMLPVVLDQIRTVDISFHDSEHSYENMKWEYQTVWPYLKRGGLLLSHDIFCNEAFSEFCKEVIARSFTYVRALGGIVKS